MISPLGPHFFRHEYGRLVAVLSRRVGVHYLELVEDAVQSALLAAVELWGKAELPDDPSAWLFTVAQNHLLGELRKRARRGALLERRGESDLQSSADSPTAFLPGDVQDSLLHMLFVCCDAAIPVESQLVLALKTLCGFDVVEIAERLFTTEGNVYKRLTRARSRLREAGLMSTEVTTTELAARIPAVHAILYTLFTEGYLSSHAESAIRKELCEEARRLAGVLAQHSVGATPETFALLALMHLHTARMAARQDGSGGLLLLEEQDRSRFDQREIGLGLAWLARAADLAHLLLGARHARE